MPLPLHEYKAAEVLVHRHKDTLIGGGAAEDLRIPWIFAPLLRLDDFVARGTKPVRQSAPGAPIDQKLHSQETLTASRESSAMTTSA